VSFTKSHQNPIRRHGHSNHHSSLAIECEYECELGVAWRLNPLYLQEQWMICFTNRLRLNSSNAKKVERIPMLRFEFYELLRASAEVIGKGSFGTTYRAFMEESMTVVESSSEVAKRAGDYGLAV
ncbi:hypothetical protein M8C21_002142, partial [Ambrosia artemisiifolia]